MRDAKRIPAVLKAIEEAWRADPDLRLGQIVVTATNLCGRKAISPEVFSLEDEDLLRGIEALVARQKKEEPNLESSVSAKPDTGLRLNKPVPSKGDH